MQPKSIAAAGNSATGVATATATTASAGTVATIATMAGNVQTVTSAAINENADEYFPRSINNPKKVPVQGASANSPPNSHGDTVNVVFRAPVVSSSSNQSMRPPPPPPPKTKGHSEEPSSSIPDLGKRSLFKFLLFFFCSFRMSVDQFLWKLQAVV